MQESILTYNRFTTKPQKKKIGIGKDSK